MELIEELNPLGLFRVERGDDLNKICQDRYFPVLAVIRLNGLLRPPVEGEILILPVCQYTVITVNPGETVDSLCESYKMNKQDFVFLNGDMIYPGQRLLLPDKKE